MSKKQVVKKSVKKVVKPVKQVLAAKKAKPVKSEKINKSKKAEKPSKKVVANKAAKNIVSKKTIIKKGAPKPLKKSASPSAAKNSPKKPIAKKTKALPEKKVALKKSVVSKPEKAQKNTKAIAPVKQVAKPLAKKAGKPEKKEKEADKNKLIKAAKLFDDDDAPKPLKEKSKKRKKKKIKEEDDEPMIGNDPLIEEIIRSTKKRQQQPKKPKIIQTFVNPMASLTVALPDGKKSAIPKKEPKGKFELEYVVRTSAGILFEFLTSPSGLSEWFADDVNIRDGIFTFYWDGSEQKARLINFKEDKYVRMQWFDKPEGSYFEFKIEKDELTGDISLMITDFADEGSDLETSKRLWDSQVNKLLHVIGSY